MKEDEGLHHFKKKENLEEQHLEKDKLQMKILKVRKYCEGIILNL